MRAWGYGLAFFNSYTVSWVLYAEDLQDLGAIAAAPVFSDTWRRVQDQRGARILHSEQIDEALGCSTWFQKDCKKVDFHSRRLQNTDFKPQSLASWGSSQLLLFPIGYWSSLCCACLLQLETVASSLLTCLAVTSSTSPEFQPGQ